MTKPIDEKDYLRQMILKLKDRGWVPDAYNVGDGHMPFSLSQTAEETSIAWLIEQVSAVDQAWLRFKNADGKIKTVMLVWGNDPHGEELFADHTEGHGFEDALGKSHNEIFPED